MRARPERRRALPTCAIGRRGGSNCPNFPDIFRVFSDLDDAAPFSKR